MRNADNTPRVRGGKRLALSITVDRGGVPKRGGERMTDSANDAARKSTVERGGKCTVPPESKQTESTRLA